MDLELLRLDLTTSCKARPRTQAQVTIIYTRKTSGMIIWLHSQEKGMGDLHQALRESLETSFRFFSIPDLVQGSTSFQLV